MSNNAFTSWAKSSRVSLSNGAIVAKPNALNWSTTLTANSLRYQYSAIKATGVKLKVIFDVDIENADQTEGRVNFSCSLYGAQNPTSSTTRRVYFDYATPKGANGHHHIERIMYPVKFTNGSGSSDSYYVGARIYFYTGAGSTVTVTRVTYEVSF